MKSLLVRLVAIAWLVAGIFVVHDASADLSIQRWANAEGDWVGTDWLSGDFNGDGLTDMALVWDYDNSIYIDVHLSTGASFGIERWATAQGSYPDNVQFVVGDFNCDGKADIGDAFEDNGLIDIDVHLSTGNGFVLQRWANGQGDWVEGTFVGGDFNGDRCSDIALAWNDGGFIDIDVHQSYGTGFGLSRWATHQGGWIENRGGFDSDIVSGAQWLAGDFTGDGRSDLVLAWATDGQTFNTNLDVHASTGSSFTGSRWFTSGVAWQQDTIEFTVSDLNGDGVDDVAAETSYTGPTEEQYIDFTAYISSRSYFNQTTDYSHGEDAWQGYWVGSDDSLIAFRGGDFNGDHIGDIADAWDANSLIYIDAHVQ